MRQDLTEIICVIDKSGSMQLLTHDVIGGFNKFLLEQKAVPGKANMTVTFFDTSHIMHCIGANLSEVKMLNLSTYQPSGFTALLDAIGITIDSVGQRLKNTSEDERPAKVIFLIMTDGEENSSKQFTLDQIKSKIQHQTDAYKWEFVFIGANQDSFASAASFGINANNTTNYVNTSDGVRAMYSNISACTTAYRVTGKVDTSALRN